MIILYHTLLRAPFFFSQTIAIMLGMDVGSAVDCLVECLSLYLPRTGCMVSLCWQEKTFLSWLPSPIGTKFFPNAFTLLDYLTNIFLFLS
jgi:hypothetical protein